MCARNRQHGLSLIELMIAMLIGVFLLAGVLQIFLSAKQSYRVGEGVSRLQENARFALELLTRDIRMSGFQGCASLKGVVPSLIAQPQSPNPNPTLTVPSLSAAITGTNNVANNWNASACGASNACVAGTDAVTIQFGDTCDGNLTGNMGVVNANIQITAANSCNIQAYDPVLISDCSSADLFIATSSSSGTGTQTIAHANNQNSSNNLSKAYGTDAELYLFRSFTYFIRTNAGGEPALWRLDNTKATGGANPIELIEGIENLQISYGEDTDNDNTPNYYVAANSVVDMAKVVSVNIDLLTRTLDNNLASLPLTYIYNDTSTTATDRRIRRAFSSTVGLRNRLQ
nr:PilW family protein [Methylomonas methanica]